MSVIEVTNLTKYYGKSRGIVDVTFAVEEGEIFGFIGPTVRVNPPPFACCCRLSTPAAAAPVSSVRT